MTKKRTARRDAPAEPRNGRCGARRKPRAEPGRAGRLEVFGAA